MRSKARTSIKRQKVKHKQNDRNKTSPFFFFFFFLFPGDLEFLRFFFSFLYDFLVILERDSLEGWMGFSGSRSADLINNIITDVWISIIFMVWCRVLCASDILLALRVCRALSLPELQYRP